jgi:hypothetical protein
MSPGEKPHKSHKFAGRSPEARRKQLANLKADGTTHGAYSKTKARDLRIRFVTELSGSYPNATPTELQIQALRLVQLELLSEYLLERGPIKNRRDGSIRPAATALERISAAYERQAALLAERERGAGAPPAESLEAIVAELAAGEQIPGQLTVEDVANGDGGS